MNMHMRIPWFLGAPAFDGAVHVAALLSNYLGADYFKRTRLQEANPLAAAAAQGTGNGEQGTAPSPVPSTSVVAPTAASTVSGPVVLAQGRFRDGEPGHRGSGTAKLGRDAAGKPVLVLENFSVTNGPDLHVILGETTEGSGKGLDLGKLKATDGTFSYEIPPGADLASFKSVTIWCASFPTVFAVATLEA
jgi:hypothetical protein